jgi:hypothetical protein
LKGLFAQGPLFGLGWKFVCLYRSAIGKSKIMFAFVSC